MWYVLEKAIDEIISPLQICACQWWASEANLSVEPMTDVRETRTKNSHEIEHALFDVRKSHEKYLASWMTHIQVSHMSFSYVCHGL